MILLPRKGRRTMNVLNWIVNGLKIIVRDDSARSMGEALHAMLSFALALVGTTALLIYTPIVIAFALIAFALDD